MSGAMHSSGRSMSFVRRRRYFDRFARLSFKMFVLDSLQTADALSSGGFFYSIRWLTYSISSSSVGQGSQRRHSSAARKISSFPVVLSSIFLLLIQLISGATSPGRPLITMVSPAELGRVFPFFNTLRCVLKPVVAPQFRSNVTTLKFMLGDACVDQIVLSHDPLVNQRRRMVAIKMSRMAAPITTRSTFFHLFNIWPLLFSIPTAHAR